MVRRLLLIILLVVPALAPGAQPPPAEDEPADPSLETAPEPIVLPPPEPPGPRDELFLAIELNDVDAARVALENGAEIEINRGNPSPLATAALHDNPRMVALLLDAGGDPAATRDSPLEEAIRNQSPRMIELLMRAGASVPGGARGRELFRLAQRGERAGELAGILLDRGADPDLCLAAAAAAARIDMMALCLDRGADPDAAPAEPNLLGVALRAGDRPMIDRLLAAGLEDRVIAGALPAAVAVGDVEMVRRALASGAAVTFADLETAVSRRQPEIALLLLEESDEALLESGDVASLIQQAEDLGFPAIARLLRQRSGLPRWPVATLWPLALLAAVLALGVLLLARGRRDRAPTVAVSGVGPAPSRSRPASAEPGAPQPGAPQPGAPGAPQPEPAAPGAPQPGAAPPGAPQPVPAAPGAPQPVPAAPGAPQPVPAAPGAPQPVPAAPEPAASEAPPEPRTRRSAAETVPLGMVPPGAPGAPAAPEPAAAPQPAEGGMPQVALTPSAAEVFDRARRQAASADGYAVLVTPDRELVPVPCPDPGAAAEPALAEWRAVVPSEAPMRVAMIAAVDAASPDPRAIPFLPLVEALCARSYEIWIFEGHVSALEAGFRDADALLVDDAMVPYLPGNWRSVAGRTMRGSDVVVYERKTGTLRRLS